MSTFILGSKPNPIIPDVKISSIISANNSYFFYDFKLSSIDVSFVLDPHLFVDLNLLEVPDYEKKNFQINRELIKKIKDEEVFIRPPLNKKFYFKNNQYQNLPAGQINFITYESFDYIIKKYFNINIINYFKLIISSITNKNKFFKTIKKIFTQNLAFLPDFKISTGFFALLIALENKKFKPPFYLIGVGMDTDGYIYLNDAKMLRNNHLKADLNLMKCLKRKKIDIRFTDKKLNDLFNSL